MAGKKSTPNKAEVAKATAVLQKTDALEPGTLFRIFKNFLRNLFQLGHDTDEKGTIDSIKRGIEFSGGNLWSLVFAIFIASVGLNVNSTAVVIGAMLISPLMGPIMGTGLAVGIYDFALLRKSLRNLGIAAVVSVMTSAFYFWISPLTEAQSELLARTTPTLYDVLIAVFGGAAGIVAGSRKDKTNAIPGVAIATALMPPLCTAGYGLANGNYAFFFGAMYLFLINCIFICFSTIFFVQLLKFKKVSFIDRQTQKKVRYYMIAFGVLTIIPSSYFAYRLVDQSFYKANSSKFVKEAIIFPGTRVLNYELQYSGDPKVLSVALFGNPLEEDTIQALRSKMGLYGLEDVRLQIDQARTGSKEQDTNVKDIIGNLYKQNETLIKTKEDQIRLLENELRQYKNRSNLLPVVSREISFLFPTIESFSFGDVTVAQVESQSTEKEATVIVRWKRRPGVAEQKKLELYIRSRLNLPKVRIIRDGG